MKSIEWIDKLITEREFPSDRQAALAIGMPVTTMSSHRNGRTTTLENKYAFLVEKAMGLPRGAILAD